jgi:PAS domain S-box-containing protein
MGDQLGPKEAAERSQRLLEDLAEARERVAALEAAVVEEVSRAREASLEQAERDLRLREAIIDASVAGLAVWDLDGSILRVNPAFLAMWGYDNAGDVQGRDIHLILADDPKAATVRSSVEELGGWIGKLTATAQDGSPFTAMVSASLFREPDGKPACVVGSFVEMTYRERLSTMMFQQSDWLQAVREIDRGILSAANPERIADSALAALHGLVPHRVSSVTLLHMQDSEAELLAIVGEVNSERAPLRTRVPISGFEQTIEALQQNETLVVAGKLAPPLPALALGLDTPCERLTYTLMPLVSDGALLGSLNLVLDEGQRLAAFDQSIARHFGDSLAIAIRHAQLGAAVADLAKQLKSLGGDGAEPLEA